MNMLFDNVLIKEIEKKSKVIMPDKQARIPNKGVVVAVGPKGIYGYPFDVKTSVKKGNYIAFVKDRALEIELKGKTFYVVQERDILGVLDDAEI
jgi:co-chaperonin GroES (HSP10)